MHRMERKIIYFTSIKANRKHSGSNPNKSLNELKGNGNVSSQRYNPAHLCLSVPNLVWTLWTGCWLFETSLGRFDPSHHTSKKLLLRDQLILFVSIKLLHPVLYFPCIRNFTIVALNAQPHNQGFQLCLSQMPIFFPSFICFIKMVKEPDN